MFEHEIIRTSELCITPLPRRIISKVRAFLTREKIPYRLLTEQDIPDGVPGYVWFRGELYKEDIWAIECDVDPQNLHNIAEALYHVGSHDITGETL